MSEELSNDPRAGAGCGNGRGPVAPAAANSSVSAYGPPCRATNSSRCIETFDSGEQGGLGPWFGWFSNSLEGYPETLNLKCQVHPADGRVRPKTELEPTDHPLAVEQLNGITFDRLLDIYAVYGHDIRPSLTD